MKKLTLTAIVFTLAIISWAWARVYYYAIFPVKTLLRALRDNFKFTLASIKSKACLHWGISRAWRGAKFCWQNEFDGPFLDEIKDMWRRFLNEIKFKGIR